MTNPSQRCSTDTMYTLPGRSVAEIPVLETDRLRLRASRIEDFDAALNMWQDEDYIIHTGGRKRESGEVWTMLQRNIGSWGLFGFGYLTIADRSSDAYIGECGFMLSRRAEIRPALPLIPEAGWGIARPFWGKGIVLEAMSALMNWADCQDPSFPCQCIIDPGHVPSEKIAQALKFQWTRRVAFGKDNVINVYERNIDSEKDR